MLPTAAALCRPAPRWRALICAAGTALALQATPAQADLLWSWSYSGSGVSASGQLWTGDSANGHGEYLITNITGQRNGDPITGLWPAGSAIPGNEPFAVDNLVAANGQLTGEGIGIVLASGAYANVFFAAWQSPPGDVEFLSIPAGPLTQESSVRFELTGAAPEPGSAALAALALLAGWRVRRTVVASTDQNTAR